MHSKNLYSFTVYVFLSLAVKSIFSLYFSTYRMTYVLYSAKIGQILYKTGYPVRSGQPSPILKFDKYKVQLQFLARCVLSFLVFLIAPSNRVMDPFGQISKIFFDPI